MSLEEKIGNPCGLTIRKFQQGVKRGGLATPPTRFGAKILLMLKQCEPEKPAFYHKSANKSSGNELLWDGPIVGH